MEDFLFNKFLNPQSLRDSSFKKEQIRVSAFGEPLLKGGKFVFLFLSSFVKEGDRLRWKILRFTQNDFCVMLSKAKHLIIY